MKNSGGIVRPAERVIQRNQFERFESVSSLSRDQVSGAEVRLAKDRRTGDFCVDDMQTLLHAYECVATTGIDEAATGRFPDIRASAAANVS